MTTPEQNNANATGQGLDLTAFEGHTPGEWKRASVYPDAFEVHGPGEVICRISRPSALLIDWNEKDSFHAMRKREHANARLIAAAPQLLSELRASREREAKLREALEDAQIRFAAIEDSDGIDAIHAVAKHGSIYVVAALAETEGGEK